MNIASETFLPQRVIKIIVIFEFVVFDAYYQIYYSDVSVPTLERFWKSTNSIFMSAK